MCRQLSKLMAGDGEGATKLLVCKVNGATDLATARTVAKERDLLHPVQGGHVRRGRQLGPRAVRHWLFRRGGGHPQGRRGLPLGERASVEVCENGAGIPFSEEEAKKVLSEDEIDILVTPARRQTHAPRPMAAT